MPLPSSAPISFSQVRTEFGTGSASLSSFYRGGAYVPNNGYNAAISATAVGLALSQFYGARAVTNHTVDVSPAGVSGSDSTGTPGANVSITTNAATATPSNGVGPFTYAWSHVSGDTFTVNSPTSASTTFSKTAAAPVVDGTYNLTQGVYRCTVTDTGNGSYTAYDDVTVTGYHYYSFA